MALSNQITVTITGTSPAVTQAGFGVPAIVAYPAWVERERFYATLAAVAVDFAAGTYVHDHATAIFAQDPAPSLIAVIRGALPPTQIHDIAITTVEHSALYRVMIDDVEYSYQADSATTNDEIATGLAAAIDLHATLVGTTTGSAGSLTVRATASIAATGVGGWHDIYVLDKAGAVSTNYLAITQVTVDAGIAADLTACLASSKAWYCVINPFASAAIITAQNAWIDSNKRTAIFATQDSPCANVADSIATDIMKTAETASIARTMLLYHPRPGQAAGAAWAGNCLPLQPGSETWANKTLTGVDKVALTGTQSTNILDKHGNVYWDFAGVGSTFEGWVPAGTYFDQVRAQDQLEAWLQEGLATLLLSVPKIPYTDAGVAMIRSVVESVLKRSERVGMIRSGWTTTVEPVADQSTANKAARLYPAVAFAATWAGAIHKIIPITGTVTV